MSSNTDLNSVGTESLECTSNQENDIIEDKIGKVMERLAKKKSIAFQRHSVHQINISNKVYS